MLIWYHGLFSWILAGALVGLLAWRLIPGRPRLRPLVSVAWGTFGAGLGGVVATYLGFGGLAAFDPRGLTLAAMAAVAALLAYRLASLER